MNVLAIFGTSLLELLWEYASEFVGYEVGTKNIRKLLVDG